MKQNHKKTLVRLTVLYFFFSLMGGVYAQASNDIRTQTVTIGFANESLREALFSLGRSAGFSMALPSDVDATRRVDLPREERTVEATLSLLLQGTNLDFQVQGSNIVFSERPVAATAVRGNSPPYQVTGRVVSDATNETLPFATVRIRGTTVGTITSLDGDFTISVPSADAVLIFSLMGYEDLELPANISARMDVRLAQSATLLEGVVITGLFDRPRDGFVGSVTVITQEELRSAGSFNVLQSIQNIDPSFVLLDNFSAGSNPNVLPDIQLRGQSGLPDLRDEFVANPNMPLFILDGFEVSPQRIFDMDMDRIASVTILKDASAKAIYGARAANGVVVLESVRPQAGRMRVSYSGSLNISMPDLSSYNLTNAAEKLEVERLAGLFTFRGTVHDAPERQLAYDLAYSQMRALIMTGVNTDWLAQPVRLGIGQRHSFTLDGGDQHMLYEIGLSYNDVQGVMRGSNRQTTQGRVSLTYRRERLRFRNDISLVHNIGHNSPYGSFREFARMNPYFTPRDADGNISRVAGYVMNLDGILTGLDNIREPVGNPMWNTTLNGKDFTRYMQITNNFQVEWSPIENLRARGRFGFTREDSRMEIFLPASHTAFIHYTEEDEIPRRGRYTFGVGEEFRYSSDINITYSKSLGDHFMFGNVGWVIHSNDARHTRFIAEGFPNDFAGDILFARQFPQRGFSGSSPTGWENVTRSMGFLGVFSYMWQSRYMFDVTIRRDGSSQFGRDNRWGTFWSVGAGWNLHNEPFMRNMRHVNLLKIRGSMGYTGSANFSSAISRSTYVFSTTETYLGRYGALLVGHHNNNLQWQRQRDQNIGVDMEILNRRIALRFDYYVSNTDQLLTDVTIPSSTGFRVFRENLGVVQNVGVEFSVRYNIIQNRRTGTTLSVFVSGAHNRNTIKEISNSLAAWNDARTDSATAIESAYNRLPVVRFAEGQSMTAIWAVPSLGIDPASGREIFARQDGTTTFIWSPDDLAIVGDREPTLRGNFGFNFEHRGFRVNAIMRYQFGGQLYNQTLVDRVENADPRWNVDRRVLTDRWNAENAGEPARFRNIGTRMLTRATSRFVEDRNELSLAVVGVSYDLTNVFAAARNIGFRSLRLGFDMNEVFVLSSIQLERGLDYPFARMFSISLRAEFN